MENHLPGEQPGLIPGSPPPRQASVENKIMPPYNQATDTNSQAGTYYTAPPTILEQERRICGLRVLTFALLLALIIVIIAAAVGGGVGGALAVNNAKTSCLNSAAYAAGVACQVSAAAAVATTSLSTSTIASATASATASSVASTATTIWGPKATTLPFTGCPDNDNKIYNAFTNGAKFQMVCGKDIPNTGHSDLLNAIVQTFQLCMELCASWNDIGKTNGNASIPCKGVAFIPTHVNGDGGGAPVDCVLKSISTGLAPNSGYDVDSAIIVNVNS